MRRDAPATVAEAAQVLDLTTLPLVEGSAEPAGRRLANLNYSAPGEIAEVFAFHRKQLTEGGNNCPMGS